MAWAPDYAELQDVKDYVRVPDEVDDAQIALAISASSRAIDLATNRQFGQVAAAEDRYYEAVWDVSRLEWLLYIDDLAVTTGLTVATDPDRDQTFSGTITNYVLLERNAVAKGRVWTSLAIRNASAVQPFRRGEELRVHALFGWPAVPPTIKEACLLQSSRLVMRRDSPFGVAGSPTNGGSELRLLAKLDPDVDVMAKTYQRTWGAV
jgi:hypothetical protein